MPQADGWTKSRATRQWFAGLFSTLIAALLLGAGPAGGKIDVSVRAPSAQTGAPPVPVYVALVAMDAAPHRPSVEAVGEGGAKWANLAPGRYLVLVDAPAFDPMVKEVRLTAGGSEQVSIDLVPQFEMSGSITDEAGNPVRGALVSHPRFVPPPEISGMSELARRTVGAQLRATTDANGWWQLPVMNARGRSLLVEAPGFEPQWLTWAAGKSAAPDVTLRKGASLQVTLEKAAPDVLLQLVPATPLKSAIPAEWQPRIWTRQATETAVDWSSLPPGTYDVVASWPDPKRFAKPVKLRRIELAAGSREQLKLELPVTPALSAMDVSRVFVPDHAPIPNLRAFARRNEGGFREVRAAEEETIGGRVLYADAPGGDVWFTTDADVMLAPNRVAAKEEPAASRVEAARYPSATGKLRVSVPEGSALPLFGDAEYHECTNDAKFVLPVNVAMSGDLAMPLLVGCRAVTLRFESYSPVVMAPAAQRREEVWLGAHALTGAATAEIHVVQKPGGADVAGAIVTASVTREKNQRVVVAKSVATQDGRVVMNGLPSGEEILFQAQQPSTKLSASETRKLESGERAVIDPLGLPVAAKLTIAPKFDEEVQFLNADAAMTGVHLEREDAEGVKDTRSGTFATAKPEAEFAGLTPGEWRMRVLVTIGGLTQPIDVGTVELASGDDETVRPIVRPLIITGRVVSHGEGVETSLAFTDPPGPGAIRRRVMSDKSGAFRVLLPRAGAYRVGARRSPLDPETDLGPLELGPSTRNVTLTLPEGIVDLQVLRSAMPAADAQVTAMMVAEGSGSGVTRLERKMRTDTMGRAMLAELQEGTWLVKAFARDGSVAEKTVAVSASKPVSMQLDLDDGTPLEGVVLDHAGMPAGGAAVDCIYAGSGNIVRLAHADADSWGKFSVRIPRPAPQQLQCGVTTADGSIATFVSSPGSDRRFLIPPAASALTLTSPGDSDRFWLIGPGGSVFNLSWAARRLRRMSGPLTLRQLSPGAWSVVRIDSPAALELLTRGAGPTLPVVGSARIESGQSREIDIGSDPVVNATAPRPQ